MSRTQVVSGAMQDWRWVRVSGELDVESAREVRPALDALVEDGCRRLVVDLGALVFCDSSGASVLLGLRRRMHELHGVVHLVLPAAGTGAHRAFQIWGLDNVFPAFETLARALPAVAVAPDGPDDPLTGTALAVAPGDEPVPEATGRAGPVPPSVRGNRPRAWWEHLRYGPPVRVEAVRGGTARVVLRGAVHGPQVARLVQVLADVRARGCALVEVDLTGATFLSREAVWVLFADVRGHRGPGGMRLRGASGQPEYVLEQTGLAKVLD